jgi:hypothetical protein
MKRNCTIEIKSAHIKDLILQHNELLNAQMI